MYDYLPEEVMVRIFERLPTKSLVRFTCLSKRWHHIILSVSQFGRSQFQVASQSQTLTRRLLFRSPTFHLGPEPESPLESIDLEALIDYNKDPCLVRKVHTPFIQPSHIIHYCSCNGLLCVLCVRSVYIWNPTTGFYRELPCPKDVPKNFYVNYFGFGYVSATDEYKVFATITGNKKEVKVNNLPLSLSLRAPNIWKKIELKQNFCAMRKFGTLFHEALHWLTTDYGIVAFDLNKEELRIMPLPIIVEFDCELGVSPGGCLCLLKCPSHGGVAELWVMRQYNIDDSWTKQTTFKLSRETIRVMPVWTMETSVIMETWETKLTRRNHKLIRTSGYSEDKVEICIVSDKTLNVVEYQETLLWLP